ncbi:hypothetical protein ACFQZE_08950 [Paenibacillus sp. GCM10027627]|uniref:hypothetical protein n=1 Tax=unclassified Paenibacillus TaxID=185978 RepID=UPI003641F739
MFNSRTGIWVKAGLAALIIWAGSASHQNEAYASSAAKPYSEETARKDKTVQDAAADKVEAAVSEVERQAKLWVDELSSSSTYAEWKAANLSLSPLGPGTHSWLVLLKQRDKIVGYLIVHAAEDGGYRLGEYGTGAYPLFNEQSLQLSLLQLQLIQDSSRAERIYLNPLQAAWKIESKKSVTYTDAYSGEGLPPDWNRLISGKPRANKHGVASLHAGLLQSKTIPSFHPYGRMPWLTKPALSIKNGDYSSLLQAISSKKEIRYTVDSFGGTLTQVWSVVGYDKWDSGELFLALDTDEDNADRRYIPIELLVEMGRFYR